MKNTNPFVGTWQLTSWKNTSRDGVVTYPCGSHPVGYLLYTEDGYMAAEVMDPDRHLADAALPPEPGMAQTPHEKKRLTDQVTFLAYCGTYSYSIEEELMTHSVRASSIPSWVGKDQSRRFEFKNGKLFLTHKGAEIIWKRALRRAYVQ